MLQQVATWSRHNSKVNLLLLFGEHILSVDTDGNMFIWAFKGIEPNLAPTGHILLEEKFTPSCIMHPDTYLNKVISLHPYVNCSAHLDDLFKVITVSCTFVMFPFNKTISLRSL